MIYPAFSVLPTAPPAGGAVFAFLFGVHHFLAQLTAAHQEAADGEQSRNAGDAGHIAPGVVVAQNHVTGDGYGEHLQNVGGGGVNQHPHEFQSHHDGQQVMEHVADVGKICRPFGDHVHYLNAQRAHQRNEGDPGNDPLHDLQRPAEKLFGLPVTLG